MSGASARQHHLLQAWETSQPQPESRNGGAAWLVRENKSLGLRADLAAWVSHAPDESEKAQRRRAAWDILNAFLRADAELDLSGRGLSALPDGLQALDSLKILRLGDNPLRKFPAAALLALPHLQTLELGMNEHNQGEPVRQPLSVLRKEDYTLIPFEQGNAHAVFCDASADKPTACYTTDLSPCLAVMIVQKDKAACIHVDTVSGKSMGGKSLAAVLQGQLTPGDRDDTRIFLVGANDPGSAGNVRGVLACLREFGLEDCIGMASLGNGHTSAILDVNRRSAYVGYA